MGDFEARSFEMTSLGMDFVQALVFSKVTSRMTSPVALISMTLCTSLPIRRVDVVSVTITGGGLVGVLAGGIGTIVCMRNHASNCQ
jgi:hypothetical protein